MTWHTQLGVNRLPPSRMERSRFWMVAVVAAAVAAGLFTLLTAAPTP
ncbi:hypothetical protein [Phreatobacter stygius]|nr:hypothetical protein [Phreatobacter stygius]